MAHPQQACSIRAAKVRIDRIRGDRLRERRESRLKLPHPRPGKRPQNCRSRLIATRVQGCHDGRPLLEKVESARRDDARRVGV
jgi:hypothetical protein